MKQDIRRTRKASEVRPVLDEMAALSGHAVSGFIVDAAARTALKGVRLPAYSGRCACRVERD